MKRIILLLISLCVSILVFNQQIDLTGIVVDDNSSPLQNVLVQLKNQPSLSTTSDASGSFSLVRMPTGDQSSLNEPDFDVHNGLININVQNKPAFIAIYNVNGQLVKQVISTTNYNGAREIDFKPYVHNNTVYLVKLVIGKSADCFKLIRTNDELLISDKTGADALTDNRLLKSSYTSIDTIICSLNDYVTKKIVISSYIINIGNVILNKVTVPTVMAPSDFAVKAYDPETIRLSWTDNSGNETGFEIQRETSEGSGQYVTITTTSSNVVGYSDINLASTSLGYRIRAINNSTSSAWSSVAWAPARLRVLNSLYNGTTNYGGAGKIDWGKLNNIVRVRIGPTQNDVENSFDYEKLEPWETVSNANYIFNYIEPAYVNAPTAANYVDFDLNTYGYGPNYYVFIQCGWWEYDAVLYVWNKRVSSVLCDNGSCCCYKWRTIIVTNHTAGYCVISAADFLPQRNWNGT